jgi:uncharacterized protein (TIGR00255 family)
MSEANQAKAAKASARQAIRSMTGYARVRQQGPQEEVIISLRSVNHRGLDIHFHIPSDLEPYESALRKAISAQVARGHVDVRVNVKRTASPDAAAWNRPLMEAWLRAFRQARQEYGLAGEPDLNTAFRIPGMLSEDQAADPAPDFEARLTAACLDALRILNEFREREGAETATVLEGYAARIRQSALDMEQIRESIGPLLQARLHERLAELLRGAAVEPQRLAQEAAILADRSDIGEEITRLKIHSGQLEALLAAGGELGKKLDFLLQEMHRETNTILSKSNGAGEQGRRVTELALGVKSDIEKIREQSLNLE